MKLLQFLLFFLASSLFAALCWFEWRLVAIEILASDSDSRLFLLLECLAATLLSVLAVAFAEFRFQNIFLRNLCRRSTSPPPPTTLPSTTTSPSSKQTEKRRTLVFVNIFNVKFLQKCPAFSSGVKTVLWYLERGISRVVRKN